jgi:hypothetical protein
MEAVAFTTGDQGAGRHGFRFPVLEGAVIDHVMVAALGIKQ